MYASVHDNLKDHVVTSPIRLRLGFVKSKEICLYSQWIIEWITSNVH